MLSLNAANGLVICVWTEAPNLDEVGEMDRVGHAQARINGGKVALLNVIVSGRPVFDDEVRRRVKEMTQHGKPFNWAVAHLILIDGLAGAGIRAFLTTGALFAKSQIPKRVFGKRDDCCHWLAMQLGKGWSPSRIDDMLGDCLPKF
jgi:hypothetical protein